MNIIFKDHDGDSTSLRGYLHGKNEYKYFKLFYENKSSYFRNNPRHNFDNNLKILDLTFEEVVARLYNLSKQEIFEQGDNCKLSFLVNGFYKNSPFTLYDYKGDFDIHIGGKEELDIDGLRKELDDLIMATNPKSFKTNINYDGDNREYHFAV